MIICSILCLYISSSGLRFWVCGQHRFLLQCRKWFLVQMRAISRALINWSGDRFVPADSDLEYARFGMDLSQIGEQSWLYPVAGVRGILRPPGMKVGMLKFDPSTDKSSDIGKICI